MIDEKKIGEWETIKLEDALDYVIGGDWGKDENFENPNYELAYCIRAAEIKKWKNEKGRNAALRMIKKNNIQKRKLIEGDLLIEISGGGPEQPVGRTVLIDKTTLSHNSQIPKICTNFFRLMRPKKIFNSSFLNLYLNYFYNSGKVVDFQAGSNNLRNLKFTDYIKINVPLPDLTQQQQIVSKIEELFSELDKGIEQLKTVQQQLKVYRQSVLKWAFEGRLTNENVKDGELPKGWEWVKLLSVCNKIQDGSHFSPKMQYQEKKKNTFLYITAKNIRNNYMDLSEVTYVDKSFHDSIYNRCNPEYGDILLTKDGVNTGDVTLNTLKEPFSLLSSVCLFKTKGETLISSFLKYYIQSPVGNKNIIGSMTGTAIKRIILKRIKEAEIVLPSFSEQEQIVQEIESRLSVADKLEETINNSLQQAEALRQSILKKAFEGRLV